MCAAEKDLRPPPPSSSTTHKQKYIIGDWRQLTGMTINKSNRDCKSHIHSLHSSLPSLMSHFMAFNVYLYLTFCLVLLIFLILNFNVHVHLHFKCIKIILMCGNKIKSIRHASKSKVLTLKIQFLLLSIKRSSWCVA